MYNFLQYLIVVDYWQIVRSMKRQYLSYREGDFEVFCPAEVTHCSDGGEIWHGGMTFGLFLCAKFHPSLHTHTQTHKPFYGCLDFVPDNLGEPVPEEAFTLSHLSWSSIVPDLLHLSNMIHGILHVQFMHLTVFFHNLSKFSLIYLLAWHTSMIKIWDPKN